MANRVTRGRQSVGGGRQSYTWRTESRKRLSLHIAAHAGLVHNSRVLPTCSRSSDASLGGMDLIAWLIAHGGIAHRADATAHGFSPSQVRAVIRTGRVRRIRSTWIALPSADQDLVAAATASGRLTCLSLARRRRWWIPDGASAQYHLHVDPNGRRLVKGPVMHWAKPLVDRGDRVLEASVEDALSHVAQCLTFEDAMSVWESAVKVEKLDLESVRAVHWPDPASRACAHALRGLSDSGLETLFVVRLSPWGIPMRQQVVLAGHPVDVLIGTHLVVQLDGFAFHSSAADRTRDVAHDAELRLRGYTVLRFTYAQIIHNWDYVEATVAAAIARGLHLRPAERMLRA